MTCGVKRGRSHKAGREKGGVFLLGGGGRAARPLDAVDGALGEELERAERDVVLVLRVKLAAVGLREVRQHDLRVGRRQASGKAHEGGVTREAVCTKREREGAQGRGYKGGRVHRKGAGLSTREGLPQGRPCPIKRKAKRMAREDHLHVALGPERARLEQRRERRDAARVDVEARLDVVERVGLRECVVFEADFRAPFLLATGCSWALLLPQR